jgi:threonine synthase
MTMDEWAELLPMSYQERAVAILSRWISPDELSKAELTKMVADAYRGFGHCGDPEVVAPVVHLEGSHYILELFNGPTASFKDLALQLTPRLFDRAAQEADTKYMILVATSGDTGSAALEGFGNVGINTMVLYPQDGVSAIQRAQMTSTPLDSTHTIGVDGDFDWCQTAVKTLFNDTELAAELAAEFGVTLSAANSINWGRLLPQVVYHSSAYLDLVNQGAVELGEPVDVCVPCGNFGNILAAVYAKAMGIPFRDFTVAANKNNVLSDFVMTGKYDLRQRELLKTISPSIDILISSNIERMLHLLCAKNPQMADAGAEVDRCFKQLKTEGYFELSPALFEMLNKEFTGGWATEDECGATIKAVFERTGYLLDPHTAVRTVPAPAPAPARHPGLLTYPAYP